MHVSIKCDVFQSFWKVFRRGIVGSHRISEFSFWRNLHTDLHSSDSRVPSHQQFRGTHFSSQLYQYLLLFNLMMTVTPSGIRWILSAVKPICLCTIARHFEHFICFYWSLVLLKVSVYFGCSGFKWFFYFRVSFCLFCCFCFVFTSSHILDISRVRNTWQYFFPSCILSFHSINCFSLLWYSF